MNRKQFVQVAGLGAAVVATGGMTGCANKTPATSVANNGARANKAVYVPNGKNRFTEELIIMV